MTIGKNMTKKDDEKTVFEAVDELLKQYDKAMFLFLMEALQKNHEMFIKQFEKRGKELENEKT
jgi:hypothetical protein